MIHVIHQKDPLPKAPAAGPNARRGCESLGKKAFSGETARSNFLPVYIIEKPSAFQGKCTNFRKQNRQIYGPNGWIFLSRFGIIF
ncbi:hypothetical protein [Faecalibacterium gallinarum]|uniref:hypothetical protein n=1 Tax=Faecalibacterium gallinarum TaxID=2903556 RepID=UPI001EE20D3D|nr:hypothetical protein [Faecalibacterium gallinarum]